MHGDECVNNCFITDFETKEDGMEDKEGAAFLLFWGDFFFKFFSFLKSGILIFFVPQKKYSL